MFCASMCQCYWVGGFDGLGSLWCTCVCACVCICTYIWVGVCIYMCTYVCACLGICRYADMFSFLVGVQLVSRIKESWGAMRDVCEIYADPN